MGTVTNPRYRNRGNGLFYLSCFQISGHGLQIRAIGIAVLGCYIGVVQISGHGLQIHAIGYRIITNMRYRISSRARIRKHAIG